MTEELHGGSFRALTRLSNGENETLADVGETCERIPVNSLSWLLASGHIRRVQPDDVDPPRRRANDPHHDEAA